MKINSSENSNQGLYFGLMATLLWGSYPLWYKPLSMVNAWQLLAWRVIFSELFLILFLLLTAKYKDLRKLIQEVSWVNIVIMSSILGLWWLVYIYGILQERVLEVSLGYFLSPLMSLIISRALFKEKMNFYQSLAVGFASIGVMLMVIRSFSMYSFPWIALCIGFCFSFYGIFKKKVKGDPIVTQTLEIMILTPFASFLLFWFYQEKQLFDFSQEITMILLLISTGLITILPLWWYSLAARKLQMQTLSFLQFIPPSCNFLLGLFVYHEPFDIYKTMVFSLIWLGIAIFMADLVFKKNQAMRLKANIKSS